MPRLPLAAPLVILLAALAAASPGAASRAVADGATGQHRPGGNGGGDPPRVAADRGGAGAARAESAEADDDDDDDKPDEAKARFPQPVQAGQLVGRDVLGPLESQPVLGRVSRLIRLPGGGVAVVVATGGWWGWGARPVAVPLAAMALLGADMVVVGLPPDRLAALPTAAADAGETLPPGETVRVGLTRPSH